MLTVENKLPYDKATEITVRFYVGSFSHGEAATCAKVLLPLWSPARCVHEGCLPAILANGLALFGEIPSSFAYV